MTFRLQHSRLFVVILACTALAFVGVAPGNAAAATSPTVKPSTDGRYAPAPPESGVTTRVESGVITAGSCSYRQAVDDPHRSGADTSIHGWWLRVSGTCPSKANVDVYLQAYWCDAFGCRWITVDSGSGDYYAGGGSGRRANARVTCSSTARSVGWRGFVDVDLIGQSDPSGYTYSVIKNLYCSP